MSVTPFLSSVNVTSTSAPLTLPKLGSLSRYILLTNHSDTPIYVNLGAAATAAVGGGYQIAAGGDKLAIKVNSSQTVNVIHGSTGDKRLEIAINAD